MAQYTPTTETHFILNEGGSYDEGEYPHLESGYPIRGALSLNRIATKFYDQKYVGQQTGEMLSNDTVHEYVMDKDTVDDILFVDGEPEFYLGTNPWTKEAVFHKGHTQLEYWLSMSWSKDPAKITQSDSYGWEDYYGAVFEYDFQVYRQAPEPHYILADLIRNDVLPYGKYLLYVSW